MCSLWSQGGEPGCRGSPTRRGCCWLWPQSPAWRLAARTEWGLCRLQGAGAHIRALFAEVKGVFVSFWRRDRGRNNFPHSSLIPHLNSSTAPHVTVAGHGRPSLPASTVGTGGGFPVLPSLGSHSLPSWGWGGCWCAVGVCSLRPPGHLSVLLSVMVPSWAPKGWKGWPPVRCLSRRGLRAQQQDKDQMGTRGLPGNPEIPPLVPGLGGSSQSPWPDQRTPQMETAALEDAGHRALVPQGQLAVFTVIKYQSPKGRQRQLPGL
jgi:hypothetical protein